VPENRWLPARPDEEKVTKKVEGKSGVRRKENLQGKVMEKSYGEK